jgi:hypothetical protein
MNRFLRTSILSAALAATTFAALPAAEARDRYRHFEPRHHHVHRHSNGDAVAAGILGLAAGAIIMGAIAQPDLGAPVYRERIYREPVYEPDYYPPAPRRRVVVYDRAASVEPWTPAWYRYCENRYRSFNARSGTFMGYDGAEHFCVAN